MSEYSAVSYELRADCRRCRLVFLAAGINWIASRLILFIIQPFSLMFVASAKAAILAISSSQQS